MEKIYMEENQSNNNRRSGRSSTSVMMSFILAFVAIISLVAYGFGQISFAIPEEGIEDGVFPDTITMTGEEDQAYKISVYSETLHQAIAVTMVSLHRYSTSPDKYIYCIEQDVYTDDGDYTKGSEIDDEGLVFLLSYLLNEDNIIKSSIANDLDVGARSAKLRPWITQSAIWLYQRAINAPESTHMTDSMRDAILSATSLTDGEHPTSAYVYQSNALIYDDCYIQTDEYGKMTIRDIYEKALKIHNGQESWNRGINITKESDTVSVTSDEKYYQSSKITVAAKGSGFLGYKIDLSKAPEGTYIVDTNNNKMEDTALDNLSEGTQFYIRVPIDKLTDENKVVQVKVTGAFKIPIAYKYLRTGKQTVALVGKATKRFDKGLDVPIVYTPDIPDTSITTAQSIYFVGLLILLTGVGIIYSNVKPSKANS
ncbi:MAG: hypothetical protein IJ193_06945 [Bacilli bacterium]|nr:hypothetical protein [Bacilli bacterium]